MRRLLRQLVPPTVWDVDGGPRRLARTFGVALAVRIVWMPIACHADLLSSYHRSWLLLKESHPKFWVPHELLQSAFLLLYSPILRLDELIGWSGTSTVETDFWLGTFAPHPQAMLALFLFKIPYLLCDLGTGVILLHVFSGVPEKGLKALSLWLFNPITIFVFYVFSRHDSVAIFFVALGTLALSRSEYRRSALALGVAAWSRYWPLIALPFLVIVSPGGWKKRLEVGVVALVPLLAFNALELAFRASTPQASADLPPIANMAQSTFAEYLLGWQVGLGWAQELFVFPFLYAILVMSAAVATPRGDALARYSSFGACCLLALYGTAFFHPQYFSWFIFFLVIDRVNARTSVLRYLHYLQIALFVPYTFYWKMSLSVWLFAPLAPEFFSGLDSPADWIGRFGSPLLFVSLARTAMTTVCLFMLGWILVGERPGGELRTAATP